MPSTVVRPPSPMSPEKLRRKRELSRARALTDNIFGQIHPEAYLERPIPERHRIIFYVGHLEAFDWNLIGRNGLGLDPISEELDKLFAFGIDPPVGKLPQDQPGDWPSIERAREYVEQARGELDAAIDAAPDEILDMALEHRLMHAETFSYMLHNLPYTHKAARGVKVASRRPSPALEMIEITGGGVTLGKKRGDGFGWDNEFEQHRQDVAGFAISKYKITNGQYLEFVKAGGPAPFYWSRRGQNNEWLYRGLHAEVPLPLDWPVYATNAQAQAYAEWIGKALPTEPQFQRAAFGTPEGDERNYPWGEELPDSHFGNFSFCNPDPIPVTADPAGNSAFGIAQMVGNGWEWTRTPFQPFAGFEASPAYPGYSANFFDGDHFVLKGASCATDAGLLRPSFRNWFRRDYPYAYTTFRVVEN